ncbi:MAG: hypothetical protein FWC41_10835, partial [Firmicutes bacterium]|nr:hypothetical protein [Bacillota bacterium]
MTIIKEILVRLEGNSLGGLEEDFEGECIVLYEVPKIEYPEIFSDFSNITARTLIKDLHVKKYSTKIKNTNVLIIKVPKEALSYLTYVILEIHDSSIANDNIFNFKWEITDGISSWIQSNGGTPTIVNNYLVNNGSWLGIDIGENFNNKMVYMELNPIRQFLLINSYFGINQTDFLANDGNLLPNIEGHAPLVNNWYARIGLRNQQQNVRRYRNDYPYFDGMPLIFIVQGNGTNENTRMSTRTDPDNYPRENIAYSQAHIPSYTNGTMLALHNGSDSAQIRRLVVMEAPNQARGTVYTETYMDYDFEPENKIRRRIKTALTLNVEPQQIALAKQLATEQGDPYHRFVVKLNQATSTELRHDLRNMHVRVNGHFVQYYAGKQEQRNMWMIVGVPNKALANKINIIVDIMGRKLRTEIEGDIFTTLQDFRLGKINLDYIREFNSKKIANMSSTKNHDQYLVAGLHAAQQTRLGLVLKQHYAENKYTELAIFFSGRYSNSINDSSCSFRKNGDGTIAEVNDQSALFVTGSGNQLKAVQRGINRLHTGAGAFRTIITNFVQGDTNFDFKLFTIYTKDNSGQNNDICEIVGDF